MKQIIPFKKELLFKTKVSEITSISLEHTLTLKDDDLISGEFHIGGDYKMTEGSINREKFQFKLPFDIALDSRYDISSIVIDIDNFYYEIINNEALQVNIDVYVEGKKLEEPSVMEEMPVVVEDKTGTEELGVSKDLIEEKIEEVFSAPAVEEVNFHNFQTVVGERSEERGTPVISEETVSVKKEKTRMEGFEKNISVPVDETISVTKEEIIDKNNDEESGLGGSLTQRKENPLGEGFNLFDNMDNSDTYVTYYVYVVKEDDTIEKVLTKYQVTKEDIALYNNTLDIKPGTKLIIPSGSND